MKLHDLMPNEGAKKTPKRKGHGIAAGQGKTAGRGTKGEGSRAGTGGNVYRQGGALPFYRRLPFMRGEGFTPPNQITYNEVNLDQLDRFAAETVVTPELLAQAGMLHKNSNPVVVLGRGELTRVLTVKVQRVSKGAQTKIEAAGGKVELIG
jgi:large subunit ribosomal protein L15